MSMAVFLFVPTIIFMSVVAPIWLLLHYRSKNRAVKGLDEGDKHELESLLMQADKLTDRVQALERILDVESPDWRSRDDEYRRSSSDH
ncbi:envelope stress response membrane protein PspB [Marinomonas transparens]|uniref:Envelope stress response membrane protein PspB n=1 Tax=Marinomonas transparens TaxID=2795388 RepID=A0A934N0W4_9GAMM|nr:envelope stress response membrane protein PspB [Marinomonas transparens]MBJ7536063.1 envelope stress response membrane protein PspB [Marinomonas transparens]